MEASSPCLSGTRLTGFCRAIVDVACQRARIQSWPQRDFYGKFFIFGRQNEASWSSLSKQLLDTWGLCDFCEGNMELGLKAYRTYVKDTLAERCRRKFLSLIDSQFHTLCLNPGQILPPLVRLNVPWNILVASRALCRLRLLVLPLSHKGGDPSRAREQKCIFCESWTTTPLGHVIFRCEHWKGFRVKFRCLDQSITLGQFLSLPVDDDSFQQLAAWALQIYNSTKDFWKHRRSFCILLP